MKYDKEWYTSLTRSRLSPPDYVFGIVWPILYLTMGISFLLVATHKKCLFRCFPLILFLVGLFFNLLWSFFFFTLQKPLLAGIDLFCMYVLNMLTLFYFYTIYPLATYILIPYTLWITFASYLNMYIIVNNYI